MSNKGTKKTYYSKEFKINIVKEYLFNNEGGYLSLSRKYELKNKWIVRDWVKIYNVAGEAGFDKKCKGFIKIGRPKTRFKNLEEEVKILRAENAYLKALNKKTGEYIKKK